jgi:hypothetical protein
MGRHSGGLQVGSLGFIGLALLLAVLSGDILLVFAVASASAGVLILTWQHGSMVGVRAMAAPRHTASAVRWGYGALRGSIRTPSYRMAVRRYGTVPLSVALMAAHSDRTADSVGPGSASQVQAVQVLQQG